MFQGDSLQVLLWLAGLSVAGVMGAVAAPEGWRARVLWGLSALFGFASLAWLLLPAASPLGVRLSPVFVAIMQNNAIAVVAAVGIMALMMGRRDRTRLESEASAGSADSHGKLIRALSEALRDADIAMSVSTSNRERTAERALPDLRAALLSANKLYGIPLPPENSDSKNAPIMVELHRRVIEKALPYLRQGHPEEARIQAEKLLERLLAE